MKIITITKKNKELFFIDIPDWLVYTLIIIFALKILFLR